uniref:DUF4372 domain-containing protein n=1 Tax=Schistosoma mansoni TaxID=6183 RepID=A0A3Q0KUU0_SCHMA
MNFIFDFSKDVGQQLGQHLCKLDPFQFQRMNMIYKRKPVRQFGEVLESRTSSQLHNILVAMCKYYQSGIIFFIG